jgi:V/A-type H+-transporting ATPase subunit C
MDLSEIILKDDTRYAYAVGRIRALETKLFTKADFSRLLDAPDLPQALRLLAELGYPVTEETIDYEQVLMAVQNEALILLEHLCEDEALAQLFRRRYDYHNLKVLLKAKHSHQELEQALIDLGLMSVEKLAEAVMGADEDALPDTLGRAMLAAEAAFSETRAPQELDVGVDQEQYFHMDEVLRRQDNQFLQTWLTWEIDIINIKSFLRLRWLEENLKYLERDMLPGGSLDADFFRQIREEPLDTLAQAFQRTPYGKGIADGISKLQAQKSFAALERSCEDIMIHFLRRSRETSFGVEPVVAYLFLKEFEIKAVRAVLVGKLNALPKEKIKERLPSEYV